MVKSVRAFWALMPVLVCTAPGLAAQEPASTITPDRPGLGDGAHVVGKNVVQLETGMELSGGTGTTAVAVGQTLLRYGLGRVEARVLPGSVLVTDRDVGFPDPSVGLKLRITDAGAAVRVSTVVTSTLSVGSAAYSTGGAMGAATLVAESSLSDALGVAMNLGYAFPFDDAGDGALAVLITPGLSVPSVPGLGVYAGWAGFFADGGDRHIAEAGVAYAADQDTQLDFNGGFEPDGRSWFVGIGLARRWR